MDNMKTMTFFVWAVVISLTAFLCNSCDLDDDDGYSLGNVWGSIATVQPSGDSDHYSLVLDDGTTLWPAANHAPWYKPKANQRAIVYYTVLSDRFQGYDHAIMIRSISDILTKYPAENLGEEQNDQEYGDDPVKISDMWIGDGYLNVSFRFNYGGRTKHFINLVRRDDVDTPNYFEFRHNAYDDTERVGQKGLVAFNLSSLNIKEEVTLTIKVNTFEGDKEYTVKYDPVKKEAGEIRNFTEDDIVELR